jgi:hypothetical protein
MRESWTDARLEEFRQRVDERFDHVSRRFDDVDRRFSEVDRRFDRVEGELGRINDRLDGIQQTMVYGFVAMFAAFVTGSSGSSSPRSDSALLPYLQSR